MSKKPILASAIPQKNSIPRPANPPEEHLWNFNFRYFRQIEFFGFEKSNIKINWFASLLQRLSDLSNRKVSEFLRSSELLGKQGYRYHPINWDAKNIPIKRSDLDWLPKEYAENEEEYQIVQFQISKGSGRIIGFFDENWHFNILLLDPLHNLQPSQPHNYRVDPCFPMDCEHTELRLLIERINSKNCTNSDCGYKTELSNIAKNPLIPTTVIMYSIEDDLVSLSRDAIESGKVNTFEEIIEAGLNQIENQNK